MLGDLFLQRITLGDGELRIRVVLGRIEDYMTATVCVSVVVSVFEGHIGVAGVGGGNLLFGGDDAVDSGGSSSDRCRWVDRRGQGRLLQVRSSILGVSERNGTHVGLRRRHVAWWMERARSSVLDVSRCQSLRSDVKVR